MISYKGFTIEVTSYATVSLNGTLMFDCELDSETDLRKAYNRIDNIVDRMINAEVTVSISRDELKAAELAIDCFDRGLVETEFNTDGLRRFVEAAKTAHGAGGQS